MEAFQTFGDGRELYSMDDDSSISHRVSRKSKQTRDIYTRRSINPFAAGRNTLDLSRRPEGVEEQAARITTKQIRPSRPAIERDAGPSQAGPSRRQVATSRMPLQSTTQAVDRDMMEDDWRKSGRQRSVARISNSPPKTPLTTSARRPARLSSTSHANPVEIFDSDEEDEQQHRLDGSPFKSGKQPPNHGPATRSSAFGTHAKKKDAGSSGSRSGRENQRSSRSPIKRSLGPGRALMLPPDPAVQDEEEEQIEQKSLDEDIENPDGHWQGDDGIYMVATRSSPKKQSRTQHQKPSDDWNGLDPKPARDRAVSTRGKDPVKCPSSMSCSILTPTAAKIQKF
ncbi:hypothetical protein BCR39DRAFT_218619 [Naematelia encephala]|uniref:Uncharacterized protein n=1 Tax=Naematelia encephala TaxID=71784 RepID=A0A1Y2AYW8_9TREE|nr:hypothetical protein BCR39DRAFT_218619 [Naematelia encephala]